MSTAQTASKSKVAKPQAAAKPQVKQLKSNKALEHVTPEGEFDTKLVTQQVSEIFKEYGVLEKEDSSLTVIASTNALKKGKLLYDARKLVENLPVPKKVKTNIIQEGWDKVMPKNEVDQSTYPDRPMVAKLVGTYESWVLNAGVKLDHRIKHDTYLDKKGKPQPFTLGQISINKLYEASKFVDPDNASSIAAFLISTPYAVTNKYFAAAQKKYKTDSGNISFTQFEKDLTKLVEKPGSERVEQITTMDKTLREKAKADKEKSAPSKLTVDPQTLALAYQIRDQLVIPKLAELGQPDLKPTDNQMVEILCNLALNSAGDDDLVINLLSSIFKIEPPKPEPKPKAEPKAKAKAEAKPKGKTKAAPAPVVVDGEEDLFDPNDQEEELEF